MSFFYISLKKYNESFYELLSSLGRNYVIEEFVLNQM